MVVKKIGLALVFLFFTSNLWSKYPNSGDTAFLVGTGLAAGGIAFYADELTPNKSRLHDLAPGDHFFRTYVKWQNRRPAMLISDILLYGIMLPSAFWLPAISGPNYVQPFHTMAEVAALNALAVNLSKVLFARTRPAAFFSGQKKQAGDLHSFYSGHTSMTFAMGVSGAMLLGNKHPQNKAYFFAAALSLATLTAYLRMAADRHFFSDVVVGAIIGSALAYALTQHRLNSFDSFDNENGGDTLQASAVILRW